MANTKPKRAPGGSPALSFFAAGGKAIVVTVMVLVILALLWLGWALFRPDLLFNDIDRYLSKYRATDAEVSLMPDVFRTGDVRAQVIERLSKAGYDHAGDDTRGTFYAKDAGGSYFVCRLTYWIQVRFDQSDRLTEARANITSQCL